MNQFGDRVAANTEHGQTDHVDRELRVMFLENDVFAPSTEFVNAIATDWQIDGGTDDEA